MSKIPLFALLIVIGFSFYLGAGISTNNNASLSQTSLTPVTVDMSGNTSTNNNIPGNNLQMNTFAGSTPPPASNPVTPSNPCPVDTGERIDGTGCDCSREAKVTCSGGVCTNITGAGANGPTGCEGWTNPPCGTAEAPSDGQYCWLKPVIYLYPTKPTNVSVKIETQGKITISDPLYENGWNNVLAFPDGKLIYKNKAYSELFYETDNKKVDAPSSGLVVETKNIQNELYSLTKELGLIKNEQDELVEFWTPRLTALNTKYILISLVDKNTKKKSDNVLITPNPDTKIEFILYFKGTDEKINISPLSLPEIPRRVGFTSVEWGGTIDH